MSPSWLYAESSSRDKSQIKSFYVLYNNSVLLQADLMARLE